MGEAGRQKITSLRRHCSTGGQGRQGRAEARERKGVRGRLKPVISLFFIVFGISFILIYKYAEAEAEANRTIAASITPELIQMTEAEARLEHGWVTVQGVDAVVTGG